MSSVEEPNVTEPKKSRAGRDLPAALVVGFGLFFLVIFAMIYWPLGVVILLALLSILGVVELYQAFAAKGLHAAIIPIAIFTPLIVLSGYAPAWGQQWASLPWALTGGAIIVAMIVRMPKGSEGYVKDVSASALIITYLPLLASFLGQLVASPNGIAKLAIVFVGVIASDTGGYVLGASIGKHQMAPKISPKKTWEGLVGSVLLAMLVCGITAHFFLNMPWWIGVIIGIVLTFFGTVGDLVESLIKRDLGIKDMSSILPGHGGIMDRLDSLLVGIPAGWLFFAVTGL